MPMHETTEQEELSVAAMHAISINAGFAFDVCGRVKDNWGWDAEVTVKERLAEDSRLTTFKLRFQLKATKQVLSLGPRGFSFRLDADRYNDLRETGTTDSPVFLGLYQMPREREEWLNVDADRLMLRRCIRWVSLQGAPAATNDDRVTIYVPEDQLLDPCSLRAMAERRSRDQWDRYADVEVP